MIEDIQADAEERMDKTLSTLDSAFARIRTGRAHPGLLDGVLVPYYGNDTPLNQVASILVDDVRTLLVSPWEKNLISDIERAILKSNLGLNPVSTGDNIRLPLPPLTEENRRDLTKLARQEAEHARVAIRNIRRDANSMLKELVKEKEISEDELRRAEDIVQKLTDRKVSDVDKRLQAKETDLMEI